MMRGPHTTLILERATEGKDTGGAITRAWTQMRKIRGVLTLIRGLEFNIADKETLHARYQFWCTYPIGLNISEKDEFSRPGTKYRYRVVFSDNILEVNDMMKIDLVQIQ